MKVLFIGCVQSSEIFLKTLIRQEADIVGVITKRESRLNADFVDLSFLCSEKGIACLYVDNINEKGACEFIQSLSPDIGFCLGWSQLLKKEVLNLFPKGVIGFHPSALPKNRGRHPIIWALALGLTETASSFFMLEEGADTGKVVSQVRVPILYEDNARTLYDKIMNVAEKQLVYLWEKICESTIPYVELEREEHNTWRKRNKNDGKIDWRMSSRNIYNLVRALSEPYVGAHFEYNGYEYKVWEVKELSDFAYKNIEPGKIIGVDDEWRFSVKTGEGIMEIIRYDQNFIPEIGMYL